MALARVAGVKPRELAERIVASLPESRIVDRCEIAGPGFINIFLKAQAYHDLLGSIRADGVRYGEVRGDNLPRILVEYVSANPTGPLHVGHGRGAAYGDALVRVLRKAGYQAASEY
ncbi:MAG: arginine--tRNA ligase, partial [Proteobacteria bacterium]